MPVPVTLALSMLCENPSRRTGLSTLFHEFVAASLRLYPEVNWVLFAGPEQPWAVEDSRVRLVRRFPANDRRLARLWADHFSVGPEAKRLGAGALLTVGFVPVRAPLPVVMHVFSVHHLREGGGWRGVYRRRALRNGLRRTALVVVNSAWTAEQLATALPGVGPTPLISPEGVQHERFSPSPASDGDREARSELRLPPQYLLWSSNFYPYKRADRALKAYAGLPEGIRSEFPLVLIGGDWEGGKARAEALASELGIAGSTRFLGWVDDRWLPACYRGAAFHLLPTTEETFGRSVLEAMACGCPCLLQDLPVLREVAGDAAEYIDFSDTKEAAHALGKMCSDVTGRAKLREAGLRRAGLFHFERLARERVGAILRFLEQGRGQ